MEKFTIITMDGTAFQVYDLEVSELEVLVRFKWSEAATSDSYMPLHNIKSIQSHGQPQ
jgi:hypothetical protein